MLERLQAGSQGSTPLLFSLHAGLRRIQLCLRAPGWPGQHALWPSYLLTCAASSSACEHLAGPSSLRVTPWTGGATLRVSRQRIMRTHSSHSPNGAVCSPVLVHAPTCWADRAARDCAREAAALAGRLAALLSGRLTPLRLLGGLLASCRCTQEADQKDPQAQLSMHRARGAPAIAANTPCTH